MRVQSLFSRTSSETQCSLVHLYALDTHGTVRGWLNALSENVSKNAILVLDRHQVRGKRALRSISGFRGWFKILSAKKVGTTYAGGEIWLVTRKHF